MHIVRTLLLLVTVLFAARSTAAQAQDATDPGHGNLDKLEVYTRIRSSTAVIMADYGDGTAAKGTGVAVMQCGHRSQIKLVVTNAHVVMRIGKATGKPEVAPHVRAKAWTKGTEGVLDAYVLYCQMSDDGAKDLAYLLVEDEGDLLKVASRPATLDVHVNDTVFACGNPRSEEFLVDDGKVIADDDPPAARSLAGTVICHDALIEHGSSGGGLFNAKGELIGINTWMRGGKVGVAQTVDWFFKNHRFGHFAGSLTGAIDMTFYDYITAGQTLRAAVVGTYRCEKGGALMNGRGITGRSAKARDKDIDFGAITLRVGNRRRTFDNVYAGPGGVPVEYDRVVLCEESEAAGRINFTLNDDNPLDNEWGKSFDIVYLVRGNRQAPDFGIEFCAPTQAERDELELWVHATDGTTRRQLPAGAKLTKVVPGSVADVNGFRVGDFIVGLDHPGSAADDPRGAESFKGMLLPICTPVDAANLAAVLAWARRTYHPVVGFVTVTVIRPGSPNDEITGRFHQWNIEFQ